ncbi:MAG: hypothetical protein Terrestrivirus2_5 [Terrestrivirus sp.]|uniref:Uncharacterized protein n=1 Tax=Terrestrivirus sp. TaxID=2487775 RepID=A0A3G4ZKY5_9VIRU|nr:MAG: hypothetical protein Terrestrivirus2_5 [Terrestrivirus sp.]
MGSKIKHHNTCPTCRKNAENIVLCLQGTQPTSLSSMFCHVLEQQDSKESTTVIVIRTAFQRSQDLSIQVNNPDNIPVVFAIMIQLIEQTLMDFSEQPNAPARCIFDMAHNKKDKMSVSSILRHHPHFEKFC